MNSLEEIRILNKMLPGLDSRLSISPDFILSNPLNSPLYLYQCSFKEKLGSYRVPPAGSVNTDITSAIIAGIAERYERYSLSKTAWKTKTFSLNKTPQGLPCISLEELREMQGLHPSQFQSPNLQTEQIFPETVFNWLEAQRLLSDELIWVPTTSVLLRRDPKNYFSVSTNGCALGATREEAAISAACELIERDSVMMWWWRKDEPCFVDFKEYLKEHDAKLWQAYGPWIDFVQLIYYPGATGLPTFIGIFSSSNEKNHPAFVMSAATHLDPKKAARKCLLELGGILNQKLGRFANKVEVIPFSSDFDSTFNSFEDHHTRYMFNAYAEHIFFRDKIGQKPAIKLTDIPSLDNGHPLSNLEVIKAHFKKAGFNPIIVDQTSADVRSLGFVVIRVMEAQVVDLNYHHAARRWGKKRLFCDRVKSLEHLNPFPHPFP